MYMIHPRFYGVMVSTQDSESCDPSSNLGRTWLLHFVLPNVNMFTSVVILHQQAVIAQLGER